MINSRLRPGLTLIEIIMVIAIIVILGAATTPFLSSFVLRNNTETSQDKVISSIRKAQNYAMNEKVTQHGEFVLVVTVCGCIQVLVVHPQHLKILIYPAQ